MATSRSTSTTNATATTTTNIGAVSIATRTGNSTTACFKLDAAADTCTSITTGQRAATVGSIATTSATAAAIAGTTTRTTTGAANINRIDLHRTDAADGIGRIGTVRRATAGVLIACPSCSLGAPLVGQRRTTNGIATTVSTVHAAATGIRSPAVVVVSSRCTSNRSVAGVHDMR